MASATDKALQELKLIQEYLRSQQTVLSSTNMQSVLEQQCTTWETKLRSTVIQPQDASKFVVELGQGPWQEAHKMRLASAIDDAVCGSVQPSSRRRESQTLNDFGPFLSVKDMACLRDRDMPSSVKIDQLVSRMLVLALHLPTEPTVKAVAVAGMAAGIVCPTPHDGLTLIREIKRRLKQHVKGRAKPANHLVEYPSDPSLLPESIRSVAYKTDDHPTQERLDVNDVQAHSSTIALRSSSRLVRPQSQMALVSSSSSLNAQANNPQAVMMQLLGNLGQMVQQWQQPQPTQQTELPNLQIYGSRRTSLGSATVATPDGSPRAATAPPATPPPAPLQDTQGSSQLTPPPAPLQDTQESSSDCQLRSFS